MAESNCTVSLVIVTFRREQLLLSVLDRLRDYLDQFLEIIIVDNGQSKELSISLASNFRKKIHVIQPSQNLGAVGRTVGILASSGDIVITLDDDVYLTNPNQLKSLKALFVADNRVGCVNFKILNSNGILNLRDWCHPRDYMIYSDLLFETTYISEGCCAFNGQLIRALGAYSTDLFIGQESVELAARIMDEGYGIYYLPSISATHTIAQEGRRTGRLFYYNTRNIYWIAIRRFPKLFAIQTVTREWLTLMVFALLGWQLLHFLRGCFDAIRQTRVLLRQRSPIASSTIHRIKQLNRLKPTILSRLMRLHASRALD